MSHNSPFNITTALRLAGAGALLASGGIHLDLYVTGYHAIPTIGPLFLLQTIAALAAGSVIALYSRPIVASAGALLAIGTLAGYLSSRAIGLFGFHEVATTAGLSAGLLDTVAFTALGYAATSQRTSATGSARSSDALLSRVEARASDFLSARATGIVLPFLGAAAVVLSLVGGLGAAQMTDASAAASHPGSNSVTITINNFAFVPATLTVKPGQQVLVHNEDPVTHTLTAVPGSSPFGRFRTGNIASGQTKSIIVPKTPGSYQYYCAIHNFMTGVITVKS